MISRLLLALGLLATGSTGYSLQVDAEDALVVEGVIQDGNISHLGVKLLDMADEGREKADLIINSPGGEVITGFFFLSQMDEARARGLKIRCFVPEVAASMAFGILVHCDERHTLSHAFLLWHRARISVGGFMGTPMTAPQLLVLGRDLANTDQMIFRETLKALGIKESVVRYHFEHETLHVGTNLHMLAPNFITSHTRIQGLYEALRNTKVPRSKQERGFFNQFRPGEIIYIHNRFLSPTK